jgi:hypothetical protein
MKNLLDKIKILEYKYKKLKDNDSFNIFTVLHKGNDEVKLHSQFLYTLLNPEGSHNKKNEFLRFFLDILEIENFDYDAVKVYKEYRDIDILIRNTRQAVIIENKIWADDTYKQIEGYYDIISKEGIKDIRLIYLSPHGREPSEDSLGRLKNDQNIDKILTIASYKNDISRWIEECIKSSALQAPLRETLCQYQKLIAEITGMTMNKEECLEIIELLAENDNIVQAHKIASNWNHVKWHTEWGFWIDFEKVITQEYKILEIQKYTSDLLTGVIHRARNRNPWYGIMFEIAQKDNFKFCILIERSFGDLYYGLTILDSDDKRDISNNKQFDKIAESLEETSELSRDKFWIGRSFLKPRINFEIFGNEETLKLANKEVRAKLIHQNWQQIKDFIEKCKTFI